MNHVSKIIEQIPGSVVEFYYGECVKWFLLHPYFLIQLQDDHGSSSFCSISTRKIPFDGQIFAFYLLCTKVIQASDLGYHDFVSFFFLVKLSSLRTVSK